MSDNPFKTVSVLPGYNQGFAFGWSMHGELSDPPPWKFTVQIAEAEGGDFEDLSPELPDTYSWQEEGPRLINKQLVYHFRIKLVTPSATYYSHERDAYGGLNRREFLIARDIMRREVLHARKLAGVHSHLWVRSTWGPKCTECRDPILGNKVNSDCNVCLGVGRVPPYHGPYDLWITYSLQKRDQKMAGDGTGTREDMSYVLRMVGSPYAKDGDVVVDVSRDKRYYVDRVENLLELRRVPIVQTLLVHEAPVSEPIYKLNEDSVSA